MSRKRSIDVDRPVLVGHDLGGGVAQITAVQRPERFAGLLLTNAISYDLPDLGISVRIVWGEADQFQKLEYGERLARDLRAPLRRIPGGKHFTPEDHPAVIAEEIEALLDSVRGRRS